MNYVMILNIIYILLFIFTTFMNLLFIKNYFVKKTAYGNVVYVLKKSPSTMLLFGVIASWFIYNDVQSYITHPVIQYPFDIIYIVLEIEIIVFMIMSFLFPQIIYENGILNIWNPAFVEWNNIKSIEKPTVKDNSVWLVLKHKKLWTGRVRLYCLRGMAPTIVEYIQEKIDSQ